MYICVHTFIHNVCIHMYIYTHIHNALIYAHSRHSILRPSKDCFYSTQHWHRRAVNKATIAFSVEGKNVLSENPYMAPDTEN